MTPRQIEEWTRRRAARGKKTRPCDLQREERRRSLGLTTGADGLAARTRLAASGPTPAPAVASLRPGPPLRRRPIPTEDRT